MKMLLAAAVLGAMLTTLAPRAVAADVPEGPFDDVGGVPQVTVGASAAPTTVVQMIVPEEPDLAGPNL
jgi:hypothetical protein